MSALNATVPYFGTTLPNNKFDDVTSNATTAITLAGAGDAECRIQVANYHICTMTLCVDVRTNATAKMDIHCHPVGVGVLFTAFALLMMSIVLGNLLIMYVMIASRSVRNTHGIIKCSLALADLLQGAIAVPIAAYTYVHFFFLPGPYSRETLIKGGLTFIKVYRLFTFFFVLSNTLSLLSLILLSTDRFMAICYPLRYHAGELMTHGRAKLCVILTWMIAFGLALFFEETLGSELQGLVDSSYVHRVVKAMSIIFGVLYMITIFLLAATVRNSFKTIRSMQRLNALNTVRPRESVAEAGKVVNIELKFAKTVGLMVVFFTMSITPYVILKMIDSDNYYLEMVFEYLMYTNSLWNVFIYSLRCRDFQLSMIRLRATRTIMAYVCKATLADLQYDVPMISRTASNVTQTIPAKGTPPVNNNVKRVLYQANTSSPSTHTLASITSVVGREATTLLSNQQERVETC